MVKVVNGKSPSISKYYGWSPEFKAFVNDCLIKNPAHRISAAEILTKHKNFFAKSGGEEYIRTNLLNGLRPL
jgi:serine/threonine protein kinase